MLPEPERDWNRIDVEPAPPCSLITRVMQLAMVHSADRHDELVAHSASERAGLGKGEVMRIGWDAAAHKARLPQHEFPVVLIAHANRLAKRVDHVAEGLLLDPPRSFVGGTDLRPADGHHALVRALVRDSSGRLIRR
jgi:hypothetical protein